MIFDPILSEERIDAMTKASMWDERTINDYMDDAVARNPDGVAIIDHNTMTGRSTTFSYRQLRRMADRMALGLSALGVGANDVVAVQLPNWWHFAALYLGCMRLGATINPLMPIFRHREMKFMLNFAEAKVVVVPRRFRGFDYPAMIDDIRGELPALRHMLVVDGEDESTAIESVLLNRRWEDEMDADRIFAECRPTSHNISELIYTSGTTGQPKGVMHTSNTLLVNMREVIRRVGMTSEDSVLMASPIAHNTGFLFGMIVPIMLGIKTVLQDVWEPVVAAQLIQDQHITYTMGSTPFLSDMTTNPGVERYDIGTLRVFITAGAPIPRVLVQTAMEKYKFTVISGWGMSENGLVTTTRLDDPPEKVFGTDGTPVDGMAVRVVNEEGNVLPTGEEGRLQVQGASNFVGYLKKPEAYEMYDDMWFETGDNARMDEEGYIRITGRNKDIIIRGGENIPVVEVEELLYRHPAVQDAAVVGMPDERLGERGCAFVVFKSGGGMTFQEMVDYLQQHGLAKNYFPERLEVVTEMPRTPSGKIQKFKLRDAATELSAP